MTTTTSATSGTSAAGTAGKSGSGATGLAGDFNTFLTLLTAQLKNQDPSNAMDTAEMTNQLVSFASVEQQIATNTNLKSLIGLQQAAQLTASAPLMGQTMEVESDRLTLQDGRATLRLPAAGEATQAVVRVLDGSGKLLREEAVTLGTTTKDWSWDGRSSAGVKQADGAYRFAVSGRDAQGETQAVTATVLGTATAAKRASEGEVQIELGGLTIGFDALRSLGGG